MIDIIITPKEHQINGDLRKTLLSICGQSIKDELKIYLVDSSFNEDYLSEAETFKEKINIQVINCKGENYLNSIIDKTENKYVMFIEMGDMFYNYFSLEYLYNEIINKEADICVGLVVENEQGMYKYLEENNYKLLGKIYSKESFGKNTEEIKVKYLNELICLHNI